MRTIWTWTWRTTLLFICSGALQNIDKGPAGMAGGAGAAAAGGLVLGLVLGAARALWLRRRTS